MMRHTRRLTKERADLEKSMPAGITILEADNFEQWLLEVRVLDENPLYVGKTFLLRFKFLPSYPIEAPEVQFTKQRGHPVPINPHIYSNGHICLDLLGNGWSPIQTVSSVAISIQSMLASNHKNERPPDDQKYVVDAPDNPKESRFHYYDDTV
ncbi:ubiquitin-conjugating enzyme/RWD-like protein [Dipodascopsis tothii]|uniref:ubiquitin-conjugating enzyme/RWD-like protein n=1 Tax=Dipodascopsis tothii TaxID=44089 RepID=UPI0034CE7ABF